MPAKKKGPARVPAPAPAALKTPAKKAAKGPARKAPAAAAGMPAGLAKRLAAINKTIGAVAIVRGDEIPDSNCISTGSLALDMALCGGPPEGDAIMTYGFESSGKTLECLLTVAGFQAKHPDKWAGIIDTEKLYDKQWAEKLGVDTKRIVVCQPSTGEEALDIIMSLMRDENIGLILLDSVPGCVPKAMADRASEDKTRGVLAALMGLLCSKILVVWGEERRQGHFVTFIYTNQWRLKMDARPKEKKTMLPGGRQINHLPSTKIWMKGREMADTGDEEKEKEEAEAASRSKKGKPITHGDFTFDVEKVKHGQSIRQGAFTVVLGKGHPSGLPPGSIDDAKTAVVWGVKYKLVKGGGSGGYGFAPEVFHRLPGFPDWPKFKTYQDMVRWLRQNKTALCWLKAAIVMTVRVRVAGIKPIPPDGYLCGIWGVDRIPKSFLDGLKTNVEPEEEESEVLPESDAV